MKIPDANILLYAVNKDAAQHRRSKEWLESSLRGSDTVAFPWAVLLAFTRISTTSIFPNPLTPKQAIEFIDGWLSCSCAVILNPGKSHLSIFRKLLADSGSAGDLVTDAHLAAMALETGAELYTFDRDFGRFPGLRWRMP